MAYRCIPVGYKKYVQHGKKEGVFQAGQLKDYLVVRSLVGIFARFYAGHFNFEMARYEDLFFSFTGYNVFRSYHSNYRNMNYFLKYFIAFPDNRLVRLSEFTPGGRPNEKRYSMFLLRNALGNPLRGEGLKADLKILATQMNGEIDCDNSAFSDLCKNITDCAREDFADGYNTDYNEKLSRKLVKSPEFVQLFRRLGV